MNQSNRSTWSNSKSTIYKDKDKVVLRYFFSFCADCSECSAACKSALCRLLYICNFDKSILVYSVKNCGSFASNLNLTNLSLFLTIHSAVCRVLRTASGQASLFQFFFCTFDLSNTQINAYMGLCETSFEFYLAQIATTPRRTATGDQLHCTERRDP